MIRTTLVILRNERIDENHSLMIIVIVRIPMVMINNQRLLIFFRRVET